jgi:hypothetical protein
MLIACAVGCAFNTNPRFDIEPETGDHLMVKRYPKYPRYKELFFWKTKEYHKNDKQLTWMLSDDQKNILEQYGQPDYIRRVYFSTRRDRVHEWLYWDEHRVVQFVQGTLVWEGQITDLEKTLLLYGRPTVMHYSTSEELQTRFVWVEYRRWLGKRERYFFFINDRLIHGKEAL